MKEHSRHDGSGVVECRDEEDPERHHADNVVPGDPPHVVAALEIRRRWPGVGVLILMRNAFGLALGVGIAFLSALMTVFVIFIFPLWAIAVLSLDFIIAYALLTHSDEFE